ncbi:MAG TPA: hypothetical protein V6D19_20585 [Stenomitos sp.]
MFPFACFMDVDTRQKCRKAQLDFLKMARDGLEVRLAAINAAIASLEQQQTRTTPDQTV